MNRWWWWYNLDDFIYLSFSIIEKKGKQNIPFHVINIKLTSKLIDDLQIYRPNIKPSRSILRPKRNYWLQNAIFTSAKTYQNNDSAYPSDSRNKSQLLYKTFINNSFE